MAAASTENVLSSDAVVVDGDDVKYGFQRPDMHSSKLSGTVDSYDRHLFLCYKSHEDWPDRVEDSPLPKLLSGALKAHKKDISVKTRLTIREGSEETDGDVLIFPEMIKYRGLKDSDVDNFVEDVLVNGKPWASGLQVVLTGSHIYVCAHSSRDKRCVYGPLIDKFKEEIERKELKDQVFVSACSHVGGHKYAGNLIIFSADADGKIIGHWYGNVSPCDVPELLDQHIGKGEIIERLWRGQMGAPVEEAEKLEEPILSYGNDLNIIEKAPPQEVITEEKKEDVVSCCQLGANGFSCCRDEASEVKPVKKGQGSCNLSCCTGKWKQREILTDAAVVGAVTTVVENASGLQIDKALLKREPNSFYAGSYSSLHRGEYNNKEVNVMVLRPECLKYSKYFADEAALLRKIRHKNVVHFVGAYLKHPEFIILTENMSESFIDYLHKYGKGMDHSLLVGFALDISRGLEHLHEKNIIHTDLSLKNLLIDDKKVLKVAGMNEWRLKTPGSGELSEFKAQDIYQFGIILWQLMTGKVSYHRTKEIMRSVFEDIEGYRADILCHFPPSLLALLRRCLAATPSNRPPFGIIIDELQKVQNAIAADRILLYKCLHKEACFCER